MSNYTPLNMSLLLRETGGGVDPRFIKKKGNSFDKVFFPFSIMVLVLSLSFYAVKLMVDITSVPTEASKDTMDPKVLMREVEIRPTITPTPTKSIEKMYKEIGSTVFDPDRVMATAKDFYPDMSEPEIIAMSKDNILQWAALHKYYQDDLSVTKKLTIDPAFPIATYGAVLKDLDIMKKKYQQDKPEDSQAGIHELVSEFLKNTIIRLQQ